MAFPKARAILAITALASGIGCGSKEGGGTGGAGGTSTSSTSTTSSNSTSSTTSTTSSTGTGTNGCVDGTDCTQCLDFAACLSCEKAKHVEGEMLYRSLEECRVCVACYSTCEGNIAQGCASPPFLPDPCDKGPNCQADCLPCADATTCKSQLEACNANADCLAYSLAVKKCPPP